MLNKEEWQEPCCPLSPPPGRVWHDPPERIPLDKVIAECDRLFAEEKPLELGERLRLWRKKAAELGDKRSELSLLNELMGHYRMLGDRERGMEAVRDGFRLIGEVGITGSVSAGTILLNGATALKSFGETQEALQHYAEAFRCYGAHLPPEDIRYAGLFNNMAAAYADAGDFRRAEVFYKKALDLLSDKSQLMDRAVTEVNLAQLYHRQDPADPRIAESLDRAYDCFESPDAEFGSYYAHTCRKCAGAFGDLGQKDRERELNERADALYAGD